MGPVTDVMALAEANAAAGEAAAVVSVVERPPYRRGDRPGPGTDLDDMAVVAVSHHHPARVARDALGRFRGNARAVLQHGLVFLDVDHYLIAFSRSAGVDAVMERRLGEQRQSIGLLLAHRGRFRGNVGHVPVPQARLLVQGFSRCGQRLHEQGADFRRESSANRHHAVTILIHVKFPTHVLALGLAGLGDPVHSSPASNEPLDVGGGAGSAEGEQLLFGLGRGHPSQRTYFGVRQLTASESSGKQGQRPQRARNADALARRPGVESDAPAQPVGAGAEAVAPAAVGVELADEIEEASGGSFQVHRQLGDLVAESIEVHGVHGESPFCWGDSIPAFRRLLVGPREGDRRTSRVFCANAAVASSARLCAPLSL